MQSATQSITKLNVGVLQAWKETLGIGVKQLDANQMKNARWIRLAFRNNASTPVSTITIVRPTLSALSSNIDHSVDVHLGWKEIHENTADHLL